MPGTIKFWKDEKAKEVDPRLYSSQAEELAKELAAQHNQSRGKRNKRTQIRKFYDEVVRLDQEAKQEVEGSDWDKIILPRVHMMVAKAAYAKGRDLVSDEFLRFVRDSVNQVRHPDDLRVFAGFFEALMGFYRLHGPKS